MKRFIYAGCSFTDYAYPTWGDIIAYDLIKYRGYDYAINLGRGGACNSYIAHQLLLADSRLNLTDSDTIAVLWTTLDRHSFLSPQMHWSNPATEWNTFGNIAYHHLFDKFPGHAESFNSGHNLALKSFDAINSTNMIFDINMQGKLWWPKEPTDHKTWQEEILCEPGLANKSEGLYSKMHFDKLMNMKTFDMKEDYWGSDVMTKLYSSHPNLLAHLEYAQTMTSLNNDTISLIEDLNQRIPDIHHELAKGMSSSHPDFKHYMNNKVKLSDFFPFDNYHKFRKSSQWGATVKANPWLSGDFFSNIETDL